ncbi:hypothetical protein GA0061070_100169 [Kosakonia oryziphila]|uniref:Uncharacterized protein n=1 Tax=Kosakonia oryziphila TaxID=1005667 RepID=A0A1C3YX45_9ENTR|nr:hypothetical protein GA0061070_100169 [Kosakonia oryziphila]
MLADAVAEDIGLLIFAVAPRDIRFIAQDIGRFSKPIHTEHWRKTIGGDQPLLHKGAMLKETGVLIQEVAARIDNGQLLLAIMWQPLGKKLLQRTAAFSDGFQVQPYQRTAAAAQWQRVVTTDNAITAFCENIIM